MRKTPTRHSVRVVHPKMCFSSAHFVVSKGVCEALHGHNYSVDVTVSGELNKEGMVLDFRNIKEEVGRICSDLDHKVLLPTESELIRVEPSEVRVDVKVGELEYVFPRQDCVLLPISATTAELLAEYIAEKMRLGAGLNVEVCVAENTGSRGCYVLDA